MNPLRHIPFVTKHPSERPECQPVVDAIWHWIDSEGLTPMRACERVYGRYTEGPNKDKVRGTGMFYPMLRGLLRPTQASIIAFQIVGLDLTEAFRAMLKYEEEHGSSRISKPKTSLKNQPKPKPAPATPVRAAVAAYQQALTHEPASQAHVIEPRKRAPSAFALTIDQDGRASLQLNLVDIDAADALRCVELLRAAGLIKS